LNDMTDETNQTPTEQETPMSEIDALRAELSDMKDRMLRAMAETENTRRRAERDKSDATQYAVTRFARDMLQIADNFKRALDAAPAQLREAADPQIKAVLEGVEATERQLLATLERHGVKPIDTADAKFDPNLHQAIAEVPGGDKPAGHIVDVVQSGYTIGDRLLRPAMVTVAKRPEPGGNGVDTKA
jgi:molecular chaperone GrpE